MYRIRLTTPTTEFFSPFVFDLSEHQMQAKLRKMSWLANKDATLEAILVSAWPPFAIWRGEDNRDQYSPSSLRALEDAWEALNDNIDCRTSHTHPYQESVR